MIVSFHPCIDSDVQIILGDSQPDAKIRGIIKKASAIILPQACSSQLYALVRSECAHVFPNYDLRYEYAGKTGQAHMFQKYGIRCPRTVVWESVESFKAYQDAHDVCHPFPLIIKADQGHEGDHVFFIKDDESLVRALHSLSALERSGNRGFITQDFIPSRGRVLRVVTIGKRIISYWKVSQDPREMIVTIGQGAEIDHISFPHLQEKGKKAVREFSKRTGINLAAVDLIFSAEEVSPRPFFLEINYYFGRRGLGGSTRYYTMLYEEIKCWLASKGLDTEAVRLV